jgi:tape measure domain-containing protein
MPTLKAMFQLFDGYSRTINIIDRKTDSATGKILKASGATDNFNKKLKATGASVGVANSGLTRLISTAALLAATVKSMNISDEFVNTAARLDLINDGLRTQADLQKMIFASANRAKGSYTDMAKAISKMGLLAGEAFGSTNEVLAFTELLQKSFKISGSSATEQSSALLQLTQAMAAGRLQGDEFRSIMENAPMLADAIAKYMGKSKGELKELSRDGAITADIIKNALFMAGDDINAKFKTLPLTFSDVWKRIKNGGLQAFEPVIKRVNSLINTPGFMKFIDNIIGGINLIAAGLDKLISLTESNWDIVEPILYGIIGALALIAFGYLPAVMIQALAASWPFILIGAAIGLLVYAMVKFGDVTAEVFGYIGGTLGVIIAIFYNLLAALHNIGIFVSDALINIFIDLFNSIIDGVNLVIKALNHIPGVDIDSASKFERVNTQKVDFMNLGDAWNKGQDIGRSFGGSLGNLGEKLTALMPGTDGFDLDSYLKNGAWQITGVNGKAVDVDMSDEDLKYLRDIAERDYINKFSTATLAPNITVKFGDVHEEADANKVAGRIKKILQEEIAMAAEGAYS